MRVELEQVAKSPRSHALEPTSVRFETGRATFALAETEQRPTVLGLVAAGRMRVDAGRVLIDGRDDAGALRHQVALIDAPDISAPEPNVAVRGVVAEELMFAGHRATPRAAAAWLDEHGMTDAARRPVSNLEPIRRLRMLCELAVLRRGVRGFALVSPDRHGADPRSWWELAEDFAGRHYAVLVIAGEAARLVLGERAGVPGVPAPADIEATAGGAP